MENKYFTPDIEDMTVGYEVEQLINQKWKKELFAKGSYLPENNDLLQWAHSCIISNTLRVPYLTKEQIEDEGWTKEKSYFIKNNIYLFFEDNFLEIDSGNPFSWEAIDSEILFKGKCKDINTFRKICKLLEI